MKRVLVQFLLVLLNLSQPLASDLTNSDTISYSNWSGNINQFLIDEIGDRIQLNGNQASNEVSLHCVSLINYGKWQFRCKMEFNPSSQNYCEIFLSSSDTILTVADGFSVVIGKNYDRIELVKYKDGVKSVLVESPDGFLNVASVDIIVAVERNSLGEWKLLVDIGGGFQVVGNAMDSEILPSNYFILRCQYTSTRSTKFFFSAMKGSGGTLEPVVIPEVSIERFDLLFTEFMVDPSPTVKLPEVEYLELYNRSEKMIPLTKLRLQIGKNVYSLPNDTIKPNEYVVLTGKDDVELFSGVGRVVGMTTFPSLSNSGFTIYLIDEMGLTVDGFQYDFSSLNGFKVDGGWALERRNFDDLGFTPINWNFSENLDGGTPCEKNSIENLDIIEHSKLFNISYISDSVFQFYFSKGVSPLQINTKIYSNPSLEIESIQYVDSLFTMAKVYLKHPIDTSLIYTIDSIDGFLDANNTRVDLEHACKIGKPQIPERGDLWINEILFDASSNDGEFIELYNSSNKTIETAYLQIQYNSETPFRISSFSHLILPKSFILIISSDYSLQLNQFNNDKCLNLSISNFPQLSNSEGAISLQLLDKTMIDSVYYSVEMHHPTLSSKTDVSLERTCYIEAWQESCWKSASTSVNYSTPGYQNSNAPTLYQTNSSDYFTFPTNYFSPNNDGTLDRFEMVRGSGCPDGLVTATIYNSQGLLVKEIVQNALLLANEVLYWDGTLANYSLALPDIYVVYITGYNPAGEVFEIKRGVVVAVE